jgi:hypothetical protein
MSERNRVGFTRGTSNSAALVSRIAHEAYRFLEESGEGQRDPDYVDCLPVLTRALLVHGSAYENEHANFKEELAGGQSPDLSAYLGFGTIGETFIRPSANRAVMVGYGIFKDEGEHEYVFPIPSEFSGRTWKRISITMAWFSRVSPERSPYRNAKLSFSVSKESISEFLGASNTQTPNAIDSQRGTVFHTVVQGEGKREFGEEAVMPLGVLCARTHERAGVGHVPYGLLVTIEAKEQADIGVHEIVSSRVQEMIRLQTRSRVMV